jgi:hypothetical protein
MIIHRLAILVLQSKILSSFTFNRPLGNSRDGWLTLGSDEYLQEIARYGAVGRCKTRKSFKSMTQHKQACSPEVFFAPGNIHTSPGHTPYTTPCCMARKLFSFLSRYLFYLWHGIPYQLTPLRRSFPSRIFSVLCLRNRSRPHFLCPIFLQGSPNNTLFTFHQSLPTDLPTWAAHFLLSSSVLLVPILSYSSHPVLSPLIDRLHIR